MHRMPKDLIIIGASGHGKVVADIARQIMENGQKKYEKIQFLDDDKAKTECGAYPVIGTTENLEQYLGMDFFVAIGDADIRKAMAKRLESLHTSVPVLVHPRAIIGENVSVGVGTALAGGTVVNSGTMIGKYCIINTGATVDHDCRIGDYVHIAPGAHICGGVHIGDNTWIGAGTTIVQELGVCAHCMIGAGSEVVNDVNVSGVYMGTPARRNTTVVA